MENLFSNIISDLEIVPLFLNNIKCIKLEEITGNGCTKTLARADVTKHGSEQISVSIQKEEIAAPQVSQFQIRRINLNDRSSSPTFQEVLRLSDELKLLPEVAVAARIDKKDGWRENGRVSFMLPLPDSPDTRLEKKTFL